MQLKRKILTKSNNWCCWSWLCRSTFNLNAKAKGFITYGFDSDKKDIKFKEKFVTYI